MFVKICGVREPETALHALAAGALAVGVVHYEKSPRHADSAAAKAVADAVKEIRQAQNNRSQAANAKPRVAPDATPYKAALPESVLVVRGIPAGDAVKLALEWGFTTLQLHGDYTAAEVARAVTLSAGKLGLWIAGTPAELRKRYGALETIPERYGVQRLLLDAPHPGSGANWDYTALQDTPLPASWILAGGLTPANVSEAIRVARPGGVDVSSGVEKAPGVKSLPLITDFLCNAQRLGNNCATSHT